MKEERRIALGLERRKSGTIYCVECESQGFRMNGTFRHETGCSKWTEKPIYSDDSLNDPPVQTEPTS